MVDSALPSCSTTDSAAWYRDESDGDMPTTENGQSVPVPFSILDSEVTFAVAPPWIEDCRGAEPAPGFRRVPKTSHGS